MGKGLGLLGCASAAAVMAALAVPDAIAQEKNNESTSTERAAATVTMDDPMLAPWTGPFGGVPPFDKVDTAKFVPAFEAAFVAGKAEIDVITSNPEPANFENTIAALEDAGRPLGRLQTLFGVYDSTMSTGDMPKIAGEVYPKLAAYYARSPRTPRSSSVLRLCTRASRSRN